MYIETMDSGPSKSHSGIEVLPPPSRPSALPSGCGKRDVASTWCVLRTIEWLFCPEERSVGFTDRSLWRLRIPSARSSGPGQLRSPCPPHNLPLLCATPSFTSMTENRSLRFWYAISTYHTNVGEVTNLGRSRDDYSEFIDVGFSPINTGSYHA